MLVAGHNEVKICKNKNKQKPGLHLRTPERAAMKDTDVNSCVQAIFRADYFNSCEPPQLASFPSLNDVYVILNKDFFACMYACIHVCSCVYHICA